MGCRLLWFLIAIGPLVACDSFKLVCSRRDSTHSHMQTIRQALDIYLIKYGCYPSAQEGLQVLVTGGIIRGPLLDDWQNPYLFGNDGKFISLVSFGADGKPGGTGNGEDLMLRWRSANTEPACIAGWRRALTRTGALSRTTGSELNECLGETRSLPGIRRDGPRRFLIDTRVARNHLDVMQNNSGQVLGRVRRTKIANRYGYQIYNMPCMSPYRAFGLLNRDVLVCVNGHDFDPDRALKIIEDIRNGRVTRYQAAIIRSGELIHIVYELTF